VHKRFGNACDVLVFTVDEFIQLAKAGEPVPRIAVELRVARHVRDVHHALDLVPARPGDQLERRHALQQR